LYNEQKADGKLQKKSIFKNQIKLQMKKLHARKIKYLKMKKQFFAIFKNNLFIKLQTKDADDATDDESKMIKATRFLYIEK